MGSRSSNLRGSTPSHATETQDQRWTTLGFGHWWKATFLQTEKQRQCLIVISKLMKQALISLKTNSAPRYTKRRKDLFQKQSHGQKDEADEGSETRGEGHSQCEDAWPPALAMVEGLDDFTLPSLPSISLISSDEADGQLSQETHLKKAAGSAFTRICMCLNLGRPEVNVC